MRKVRELPRGFHYWENFISIKEERELLKALENLKLREASYLQRGYAGKRQSLEYGFAFSFAAGRFVPTEAIPIFLVPLRKRLAKKLGCKPESLAEALITKYPQGSGIGWHRDEGPFEEVAGVSLVGTCTMRLKHRIERHKRASMDLAPRSAFVLSGPARWDWDHRIPPTKDGRYSVIFRTLQDVGPLPTVVRRRSNAVRA